MKIPLRIITGEELQSGGLAEVPGRREGILVYQVVPISSGTTAVEKQKWLHEAAHTLLWELLEQYGVGESMTLPFYYTENGQPSVAKKGVYISISHAGNLAAAAFAYRPIGIDVEPIRSFPIALYRRVLSKQEQQQVDAAEDKDAVFFRLWTLKESYGKARGIGLGYSLKEVSIEDQPGYLMDTRIIEADGRRYMFAVTMEDN